MYILFAILIFGFLIFIHELGHFLAAKASHVQVNEFSICMGPKLLQKQIGETKYTLRLLPIGGYCAMEGEDEDCDNPRAFSSAPWWKRLVILVSGSFMNFLTGFVVMALLLGLTSTAFRTPVVTGFMDGCTLNGEGGLMEGDEFYSINGSRVYLFSDFSMLTSRQSGTTYDLVVIRDGEKVALNDFEMEKHEFTDENGNTQLLYGMNFADTEPANFGTVMKNAWYNCLDFTRMVWYGLSDLVTGAVGVKDMSGPVGIVSVISETGKEAETTSEGVENVLYLGAFIAVNLAVMNLLPIPALDGGRVFFLLVNTLFTAITKKKINPKYEGYVHGAGMVLLLGFMAFITVKDILQLVG